VKKNILHSMEESKNDSSSNFVTPRSGAMGGNYEPKF